MHSNCLWDKLWTTGRAKTENRKPRSKPLSGSGTTCGQKKFKKKADLRAESLKDSMGVLKQSVTSLDFQSIGPLGRCFV